MDEANLLASQDPTLYALPEKHDTRLWNIGVAYSQA